MAYPDDPGDTSSYDCLGCLMEAHRRGDIDDEAYDEIYGWLNAPLMETAPCPACRQTGYISIYDPEMMHCPSCGVYSYRDLDGETWHPMIQGTPLERVRA